MNLILFFVFVIYVFTLLIAFLRNVHKSDVYEFCNFTTLKEELLADLLDAFCYTYPSLKGITRVEFKNIVSSFCGFLNSYVRNYRKLKTRQDWLYWIADKYNSKNLVFTFLLFTVLKLLFEAYNEKNIYEYVVTRKVTY